MDIEFSFDRSDFSARTYLRADLTFADGETFFMVTDQGEWHVYAAFAPNGAPRWSHGIDRIGVRSQVLTDPLALDLLREQFLGDQDTRQLELAL